jgi:general stress protein 26
MNSEHNDVEKLTSMIGDIKFAMLSTVSADGSLHSRPMASLDLKNFSGTLWFFSRKNSIKNHDIEIDQHVNLSYVNPSKHHYVSISGRGIISEDREKIRELWDPSLKAWFAEGVDDPELSLIGVKVDSAEIWDSSQKISKMLSFVKNTLTGKSVNNQSHSEHIEIHHPQ